MNELSEGLKNWKLRLILSALLCIMGLAAMISMILGMFVELSVYDKSLVAVAIFMVGIPAYLIISGLAKIDEFTIARFLNEYVDDFEGDAEILARNTEELSPEELGKREELELFLKDNPVYQLLPDKPVKQAYFLMLISIIVSFGIWYIY
jgi:hypothetical protein